MAEGQSRVVCNHRNLLRLRIWRNEAKLVIQPREKSVECYRSIVVPPFPRGREVYVYAAYTAQGPRMPARRFPPPWSVEELDKGRARTFCIPA
jgi:hypothetical protein